MPTPTTQEIIAASAVIPLGGAFTADGHVIKDEGVALTQRANLNFIGTGVVVTDNAISNASDVTIAGGAPVAASFLTAQAEAGLSGEVNLGALTTGILKHTVAGGVSTPATAIADTDYLVPATAASTYAPIAKGVTNGDSHDHVGGDDGAAINLTTAVTGVLPIANGGTNATTAAAAAENIGVGITDTPQFAGVGIGVAPAHTVDILLPSANNVFIDATTNPRTVTEGVVRIEHRAGMPGTRPINLLINANGHGDTHAIDANFVATGLGIGAECHVYDLHVDTSTSTAGKIHAHAIAKSGAGLVEVVGLETYPGVHAIDQLTGTLTSAESAFTLSGAVYTDVTAALASTVTDTQLYGADDDYVLIGHATTFDIVQVALAIAASQSITPVFEFSASGGTWTVFNPSDGTNGFQNNGNISWSLPITGWVTATVNGVANKYWIRIRRTRNNLTTPPTEDLIKIFATTTYRWSKDGDINIQKLTVSPITATAPIVLGANGQGQLVTGLNADQLDGNDATAFATSGHNHSATYAPIAQGVTNGDSHDHSGGDGAQISHAGLSNISGAGSGVTAGHIDDAAQTIYGVKTFNTTIVEHKSNPIASASTTDLSTANGNWVSISGSATIDYFGTMAAGAEMTLAFAAGITLVHNISRLILLGSANIVTASGDCGVFRSEGANVWRCVSYARVDGAALVGSSGHVIKEEGGSLTARAGLNFIGATVTAADNAGTNSTDITITAAASGANSDITSLTALASVNGGQLAGLRRKTVNGGMDVDQRNVGAAVNITRATGAVPPLVFGPDRWALWAGSAVSGTLTGQRVAGADNSRYALRILKSSGSYSGSLFAIQTFETSETVPLNSKTVSVSYRARVGSAFTGTTVPLRFATIGTGTDESALHGLGVGGGAGNATFTGSASPTITNVLNPTLTTSFQTYHFTFHTGSTSTTQLQIGVGRSCGGEVSGGANDYIDITDVQLEIGSVATPFEYRSSQQELALCQRYYWKSFPAATAPAQNAGVTGAITFPVTWAGVANNISPTASFPVPMRGVPTVTFYNPSAANAFARNSNTSTDSTVLTLSVSSDWGLNVYATGIAGWAVGHFGLFHATASAEL